MERFMKRATSYIRNRAKNVMEREMPVHAVVHGKPAAERWRNVVCVLT